MKKKLRIILCLTLILGATTLLQAQNGLEIEKVFQQYGKNKGVTMVSLTDREFGDYELALFKSITISGNASAADFIRKCLEKDQLGAKKVKQVMVNGKAQSIFLELPKNGKLSRLVLFNEITKSEQKLTLIYIESEENSDDILKFILKKK